MSVKWQYIIIHCSATPPDLDIGANEIDKWHRQRGWKKGGYHEVIRRDGPRETELTTNKVRRLDEAGAHVGGSGREWNRKAIGICLVGGVDDAGNPENNFTVPQFAALEEAVVDYQHRFDIPTENIMGHRDLIEMTGKGTPKACPSFDVQEWLLTLGTDTPSMPPASERAWETHRVVYGDTLWDIAEQRHTTVEVLMEVNDLHDDCLRVGQVLMVPVI